MIVTSDSRTGNDAMFARYVLLPVFEQLTGYSQKAIRRKIEEGVWLEGKEYRRGPDGRIIVDMQGYYKWVEGRRMAE